MSRYPKIIERFFDLGMVKHGRGFFIIGTWTSWNEPEAMEALACGYFATTVY
jgi:hypothetical protein